MFKHLLVIHTDDSTDNCQNDYERDDQPELGPSNYRPSPRFPPPVPPLAAVGSYCQDDGDEDFIPLWLSLTVYAVYNAWKAYYPYSSSVPDIIPQTDPVPYLSMDGEIHDFSPSLHKLHMSVVSDVGEFPNTKACMDLDEVYALAIPSDDSLPRTQWQGGIEWPTPAEAYSAPPPTQLSLGSGSMPPDGTTVVKNVDSNNIIIESTSNSYNTHTNVTNIYIESGLLLLSQLDSIFTTLKVAQRKRKCLNLSEAKLRVPGCIAFWANPGLTTVEL